MIRIDLGKGGGKKTQSSGNTSALKLPGKLGLSGLKLDVKLGILMAVVAAFACLPHLFVNQYRAFLISQHQLAMRNMQSEDEKVKQEISKYQTFQREMESYEDQKRKVRERLDVVKSLLSQRGTPVSVLDAIGQALPQRAWLNSLDVSLTGNAQISMAGRSYSADEVSDFVDKLNESIYLSDVVLDGVSTQKEADVGDTKAFQIFATPKGLGGGPSRSTATQGIPQPGGQPGIPPAAEAVQANPPAH